MLTLIVIVLVILAIGGGWPYYYRTRYPDPLPPDAPPVWVGGFAPLGFVLLVVVLLFALGVLHIR